MRRVLSAARVRHSLKTQFFLEDKTSAPEVFSSYSFIPRANFETSLVMVRCYGYEIWRQKYSWLRQFWVKVHVFSTIFKNKIMPSQKLLFPAVLTWFLILGKIQDGSQDGDHCWWRHRPPAAPPPMKYTCSLVMKIKGFPLKVKLFPNTATYQKLGRGIPSIPPLLCHGGCMNLRVRPRIKIKPLKTMVK